MSNETKQCPFCGEQILAQAKKCKHCEEWLVDNPKSFSKMNEEDYIIKKISDCENIARICWLVFAILQIISVVAIIAGIWNLFAVASRWALPNKILNRDSDVVSYYKSPHNLIIIGIINILLGAVIGIIFVIFDFYIRSLILKNAYLFEPSLDTIESENNASFINKSIYSR